MKQIHTHTHTHIVTEFCTNTGASTEIASCDKNQRFILLTEAPLHTEADAGFDTTKASDNKVCDSRRIRWLASLGKMSENPSD